MQNEGSLRKRREEEIRRAGEDPRNEERKRHEGNERKRESNRHITNINRKQVK